MSNLFKDGEGDARQTDDASLKPSLFRKRYRKLSEEDLARVDAIKDKADELALLIAEIPAYTGDVPAPNVDLLGSLAGNIPANKTIALRHLEDAVYRAVKAITT